jgi:hypothetical protein
VLKDHTVLGLPTSVFINSEELAQRIDIGGMSDRLMAQIEDFIGDILR